MNTNHQDHDERNAPDEAQRMHEMLCATILGEASDEERAEVERALEASSDLRAERDRLQATIGLVTSSLNVDGQLSPSAANELRSALSKRQRRVWYRTPAFRIAASVLMIPLAWIAWRATQAPRESLLVLSERAPQADSVAKLDSASVQPTSQVRSTERLRALGYGGDSGGSSAPEPTVDFKSDIFSLDEHSATKLADKGESLNLPFEREQTPLKEEESVDNAGSTSIGAGTAGHYGSGVSPFAARPNLAESLRRNGYSARAAGSDRSVVVGAMKKLGYGDDGRAKQGEALARSGSGGAQAQLGAPKAGQIPAGTVDRGNDPFAWEERKDGNTYHFGGAPPTLGVDSQDLWVDNRDSLKRLGYVDSGFIAGIDPNSDAAAQGGISASGEQRKRGDAADDVSVDANGQVVRIRKLSPDEIESRVKLILDGCRRRPGEEPRDMFFRFWGDNPFEITSLHKLSTFAIDVDTASYTLARNYLVKGYLPPKEEVRTEEFVNYFKGDVQPPSTGTFAVETEMAPSLFGETPDCWMLRVAVRGKEVTKSERAPLALTFIIDVSGSMREENRLELVKHSLRLLAAQLDARDSVAVVTFSDNAQLVLPMTSAKNRVAIENALAPLEPQSSTNTEAGLKLGYQQALANFASGAQNRVVLLTDGVANVGVTDPNVLSQEVAEERKVGIFLNTIGVGMNNHNDNLLEQLADKGDGLCNYVDDAKEAQRALVDNFTGAFQPIARDVKIQVEFDAAQISRYRLLGYENRALADQDFRNDKVDAGEVGAGHQVVALYEVQRTGITGDGPLATVRIRWKPPILEGKRNESTEKATEMEHQVTFKSSADAFARTTAGYRRSVLVAQFAEFLRRSVHARGDSLDRLIDEARKLDGEMKDNDFHEFVAMVEKSKALVLAQSAQSEIQVKLDEYRRRQCQRAELESLKTDATLLAKLDAQNAEMEATLRELLRQRLQEAR